MTSCDTATYKFPITIEVGNEFLLQTDLSEGKSQKIAKKLQNAVEDYENFLPYPTKRKRRIRVSIFDSQHDFIAYRDKISAVKSTTGFYVPLRGEIGVVFRGMEITLQTLYHEMFHAYFEDRFIHPPAWLNEGLAEYAETMPFGVVRKLMRGSMNDQWIKKLNELNRNNAFPHIKEVIEKDWPKRHELSNAEYAISWSLIYFFMKTKNESIREGFRSYLQLLYNKKEPRKAFFEVWPETNALHDAWMKTTRRMLFKEKFML